jgi:ABC-type multidrug transport system fused ATPase/permease subunit
LFPAHLAIIG